MVESRGAKFVIDDHCTGTRYFWNEVIPGDDRLAAIAARYVDWPHCPTKNFEGNMADEREFDEAKAQRMIDLFMTDALGLKEVKD